MAVSIFMSIFGEFGNLQVLKVLFLQDAGSEEQPLKVISKRNVWAFQRVQSPEVAKGPMGTRTLSKINSVYRCSSEICDHVLDVYVHIYVGTLPTHRHSIYIYKHYIHMNMNFGCYMILHHI